jgi:hypothetical protein
LHYYSEIIVSPVEFSTQDIIQKDFLINTSKDALIIGTVYSDEYEAIKGACILIQKVDNNLQTKKVMGYVVTNKDGEFAFLVKKQRGIQYQLEVYEPLDSSLKMECKGDSDEYHKL